MICPQLGAFVTEDDDFAELAMLFREWDDQAVLEVVGEMLAYVGVFVDHVLWTDQGHDAAGHQPIGRLQQELILDTISAVTVVKRRIEPDEREAVESGAAAEEAGGSQYVHLGEGSGKFFSTAVVQFNGVD